VEKLQPVRSLYPQDSEPQTLQYSQIQQARYTEAMLTRLEQLEKVGLSKRAIGINVTIASVVAGVVWGLLAWFQG
jgi:hypothetical protein